MLIGYARVSTADQRLDLQVDRRSTALRSRGRWASPARRFSIAGTPALERPKGSPKKRYVRPSRILESRPGT